MKVSTASRRVRLNKIVHGIIFFSEVINNYSSFLGKIMLIFMLFQIIGIFKMLYRSWK